LRTDGGSNVSERRFTNTAAAGLVLALSLTTAYPAIAQVSFGSPADPPRIAIGSGVFDLAPFVGTFGTGKGAFYGYGGFGFDVNFFDRFVVTPTAAVGYFSHGIGIDLGAHTEFRTGAEFDYRFENLSRLGVGFYHMSNAGIGQHDPGVELVTVVLTMPFR